MFRYFRKRKGLAIAALISSILFPFTVPFSALIEQRMIDEIIAGDLGKFKSLLIIAGVILLLTTTVTYISALAQKSFKTKFQEDLRSDLFKAIIHKPPLAFGQVDTGEYLSIISSQSSTVANNFTQPIFYLISYGLIALFCLLTMLYFHVLLAVIALVSALFSTLPAILFNRRG